MILIEIDGEKIWYNGFMFLKVGFVVIFLNDF